MTSHWKAVLAVLAALAIGVLPGCQEPAEESDEQLKERLERKAAARPKKASLTIGSIHHFDSVEAGEPLRTSLDDGGELKVEEAYLVISAVEVHACEPGVDDYESPGSPLLNFLWPVFGGTAHAHVPSSSTRLGTPFVEDLLGKPGRARIVGEISPPLAAYCKVYAIVSPADRDVVNSTRLSTDEIVGKSLLVRGRWRKSASADWKTFTIDSSASRAIGFDAIDPRAGESPLLLEEREQSEMFLIDKTIRPSLFAVQPAEKDAAETIIERIGATMGVHRFD